MSSEQVELLLKPKPEKKEKMEPENQKPEKFSHRIQIETMKKEKRLPPLIITDANNYVPNLTYFHCITKKGIIACSIVPLVSNIIGNGKDDKVTQTHDYVMYFMNLLAKHKVLQQFKYIKIWSDGCGKHFKTYPIHYYIAKLQVRRAILRIPYSILGRDRRHIWVALLATE
jgi:hypothetical protein